MKKIIRLFIALILLSLLIIMPDVCRAGARYGLTMWFELLLPTLLPFFLITRIIIRMNLCPNSLLQYYPIFVGLLAGYPTGAITCKEMYSKKLINLHKAQSYLIVCNNASPGFLISFVACQCLNIPDRRFLIWFCVIISSAVIAVLYYKLGSDNSDKPDNYESPDTVTGKHLTLEESFLTILESTLMDSLEILVLIGGYVTLFSIFANIIMQLHIPTLCVTMLSGIMEITTGCGLAASLPTSLSIHIKSAAVAALCGFGGISSILQTGSAIKGSNLSILKYTYHKIMCGLLSCILCYIILHIN